MVKSMSRDPRSCPFCGNADAEQFKVDEIDNEDREGTPVALRCLECGAIGPWAYAREGEFEFIAIREWNKRWFGPATG